MNAKCNTCGEPMTWRQQRQQYGRTLRRGLTEAEAKAACPRCQKCMTAFLRHRDAVADLDAEVETLADLAEADRRCLTTPTPLKTEADL